MSQQRTFTRRTFVRRAGAAGAAVAGSTIWTTAPAAARARRYGKAQSPLRHIVISCQENRSFDHYFCDAPQVQWGGDSLRSDHYFGCAPHGQRAWDGPPRGYTQPDANGGRHAPFEFTALETP